MYDQQPFSINSTEMDFVTAIEADYKIPIAFRDRPSLDRWIADETDLTRNALGRRDQDADVLLLRGYVHPYAHARGQDGGGLFYRQVWARVDYRGYRNALRFAVRQFDGRDVAIDLFDADHAVSRDRLADLWPDAWVNMVLVDRGVNRAIGAMLEKEPLDHPEDPDYITINAESVLKTFFNRDDQRMELGRLREYLGVARRRFIDFRGEVDLQAVDLQLGEPREMMEFAMSENAWGFFDDFARSLGVELLDRPPTPRLTFV